MGQQPALVGNCITAQLITRQVRLHHPVPQRRQLASIRGNALRVQAQMHAKAREPRLQYHRAPLRPVPRLRQRAHPAAVRHRYAVSPGDAQELPLTVQGGQHVEVVHGHVQRAGQCGAMPCKVQRFLAGRQHQVDALHADDAVEVGGETTGIEARRAQHVGCGHSR
ncbi:hypothetical protein D3C75_940290 [compost metagenome]